MLSIHPRRLRLVLSSSLHLFVRFSTASAPSRIWTGDASQRKIGAEDHEQVLNPNSTRSTVYLVLSCAQHVFFRRSAGPVHARTNTGAEGRAEWRPLEWLRCS